MTQQDDWRPEMARLTQRQDQLEPSTADGLDPFPHPRWKP